MLIFIIEAIPMAPSPLKPIELHVLLGLSEAPLHGYALVERIAELSDGKLRLLPGNLYVVLHRLTARGLLRAAGAATNGDVTDARRRAYELTSRGQTALREELARLDRLLRSDPARSALHERSGGESRVERAPRSQPCFAVGSASERRRAVLLALAPALPEVSRRRSSRDARALSRARA